jgi:hypothetical protein
MGRVEFEMLQKALNIIIENSGDKDKNYNIIDQ